MSEFFIGQIMPAGFNFAPKYWALCNGQMLPIAQNQALFSLLGVMYGGDGRVTFALPDLRSRTPMGVNVSYYPQGAVGGTETVTLLDSNLPQHTHQLLGSTQTGTSRAAANNVHATLAATAAAPYYTPASALTVLTAQNLSPSGGSQPHPNIQPYNVVNFCIALQGIFPSRN
jgi:microcystin-dependent protein